MKKFITFEGGEGAGKSTQAKLLAKSLSKIKEKNLLTREPGGSKLSEKIRKILVDSSDIKISTDAELLLIYASRFQHLQERILPALKKKTVICDRFIHSTYCYQNEIKHLSTKIKFIHKHFAFNLYPDLTILIDLDTEIGLKRSFNKNKKEIRFEKKNIFFHKKVRQHFLKLSKNNKKIIKINGLETKKKIHIQIIDHLNSKSLYKKKLPYII